MMRSRRIFVNQSGLKRTYISGLSLLALGVFTVACGFSGNNAKVKVRDLTQDEAKADFLTLADNFRNNYGPREYKERRFGFSFEDLVNQSLAEIEKSNNDIEYYGIISRFLTKFDDGHVSVRFPGKAAVGFDRARIPVFVEPFEGKAIVTAITEPSVAALGIALGDEVVSVDGVPAADLLKTFASLNGFANPVTSEHLYFKLFNRRIGDGETFPTNVAAEVVFRNAEGNEYSQSLTWRKTNDVDKPVDLSTSNPQQIKLTANRADEINESAGINKIGAVEPFFVTERAAAEFKISKVTPSAETLKKFKVDSKTIKQIYSAIYRHNGKNVLLVRQPGYSPATYEDVAKLLNGYRAVMSQFESVVDVLVVDQTHNPGGYLDYCQGFAKLFIQKPGPGFMQSFNTDREWINSYRQWAKSVDPALKSEEALRLLSVSSQIEAAYDAKESITKPLPFYGDAFLRPDATYTWKKPVLVLIDELAGSCGDVFPMLLKANGAAKLFGKRTWGLGGNVEEFLLTNSRAEVRITRGLFTTLSPDGNYTDANYAENNGVTPDIEYSHTLADFRAGFVGYVKSFSEAAVTLVAP
jgi:C-terminal processing protease CtpA/Prc